MISPTGLTLKRPGILIPVFFLSLIHASLSCQVGCQGASSAALGGSSVCSQGYWCSNQNQAGLGFIEKSSITMSHSRPYLLRELGISALSGQFTTGSGALGVSLATQGLEGFRQSSAWLSYGLKLFSHISAGVGIHLWNSSIEEQLVHAPGISFALGLQIRINEQWEIGARVIHPKIWLSHPDTPAKQLLTIETGASYTMFNTARICSELHITPEAGIALCNGLEWTLKPQLRLRAGICSRPSTFSWGISFKFAKWLLEFSFRYRTNSGLSPLSSFTHEW